MKILPVFLVCLTFLLTGNVYSQNYYYYHGSKIPIQKIDNKILISSNREKWFNNSRVGLTATYKQNERNFNKNRILSPEIRYEMVLSKEEWQSEFRPFLTHNVIVSPFYRVHDSIVGSSIYFYVCLYESEDFEKLQKYALNNKIRIVAQDQFMPEWYILAVTDSCSLNSVQAANLFYESNMFKFATPDWRTENNTLSSDPFFSLQWGLKNTGQYYGTSGIDIEAENAWEFAKGENIVVAVIDHGVKLSHPDLINNIDSLSYDAMTFTSPSAMYGAHGTMCAGIIGAEQNNNKGISGVAPQCKIMSISLTLDQYTMDYNITSAINWAWNNGADILSNSYHHDESDYIDHSINNALTYGRGGLGCPVVFASGNANSNQNDAVVSYPASLYGVTAVGAMSQCGERISLNSCNSDNWKSRYGAELDMVAPGCLIPTTDTSTNNYYEYYFAGTSAACPHVAGVMALVLSVNPCLTAAEAHEVLCKSCDKLSDYTYCNNTYGLWNEEIGYGKVNAYKAVLMAAGLSSEAQTSISVSEATSPYTWILINNTGCVSLSSGFYSVKQSAAIKQIYYPYTENPIFQVTTNGFSQSNPNAGGNYCKVSNITHTSATLETYKYNVLYDVLGGQQINISLPSGDVWFQYTIYDSGTPVIYINNITVTTSSYIRNAFQRIEATNFSTQGSSNVKLRAGEEIIIGDGCYFAPNSSGNFYACIEPFTDCIIANTQAEHFDPLSSANEIYRDYPEESLKSIGTNVDNSLEGVLLYPNPVTGTLHIALLNPEETVKQVVVTNLLGNIVLQQDNLPDGTINTTPLANGMYIARICTIDGKTYHAKFVKK